ncbi:MAG: MmgE/PrpD family protein [Rhodobacterales bacterium]|nr:MmgE/PrpD family protein [Rhodobacterales bacterium]MDX5413916.1 MmgE/PrpD family protein [Rhodobacterales bacterium]
MSITRKISEFAAEIPAQDLPDASLRMMQLSILDWAAVGIAGRDEAVARITREMVLDEGGAPRATLIGSASRVPARAAALSNGTTSHALDYDDTHFAHIGHPSVAVIPAALAVAEERGLDGAAFQAAALIGVEASVRVGVWLGRNHYQTGFHQTATAGAFGAGMAAARLMGLDAQGCAMVLGLLATRASGLKSQFGTMGKPFNAGLAAANGVEAATLVARGMIANPDALECAQGFGPTHAGEDINSALEGIGKDWLFDTISHKFHACCHGLHAVLEAGLTLAPLQADAIERIEVTTHPRWMTVCNQIAPTTGLGAKFSYSTVLAMQVLGHDTAVLDSYSDAVCADPAVQALRARVEVTADDSVAETATRLRVVLRDGAVRDATHDLNAPMTLEARQAKIQTKARSLLGAARADAIWASVVDKADARLFAVGLN